MKREIRFYRMRRKLLVICAALPLFQASSCVVQDIGASLLSSLAVGSFNLLVGSVTSSLVTLLPEADIIQILFGGNRAPFF